MIDDLVTNPQLLDLVFNDIRKGLKENLSWLNYAFGKVERIVKDIKGNKYYIPCIYTRDNDYLDISPDSKFGNYSFFVVDDPQGVTWENKANVGESADFSLIFWFDVRKVMDQLNVRDKESIKKEILDVLNKKVLVRNGRFNITSCYELSENIFKEFTLDELDNQFLMHPYCGFRFSGTIEIEELCIV